MHKKPKTKLKKKINGAVLQNATKAYFNEKPGLNQDKNQTYQTYQTTHAKEISNMLKLGEHRERKHSRLELQRFLAFPAVTA